MNDYIKLYLQIGSITKEIYIVPGKVEDRQHRAQEKLANLLHGIGRPKYSRMSSLRHRCYKLLSFTERLVFLDKLISTV